MGVDPSRTEFLSLVLCRRNAGGACGCIASLHHVAMSDESLPLPTASFVAKQYRAMRPMLRIMGLFNNNLRRQMRGIEALLAGFERMKAERAEFAKRFGPRGWAIYDRLSVEIVHDVVIEANNELSDQTLINYHLDKDNLHFLGYRFKVSRLRAWHDIYFRAVERALAEDFLSSVPLVLMIIDGICTTTTGENPFGRGPDTPVFDSEVSGPGGLSAGLAVFGSTRGKLDTDPIDRPYRNGILHGVNPSYGNALVAAKAFNMLQAMVDYSDRRADEVARIAKAAKDQRQPSWSELAAKMQAMSDMGPADQRLDRAIVNTGSKDPNNRFSVSTQF